MSTDVTEVQSGLEGVVAFATEIAEPDREGGALRYRGVDIEELVGSVPYEQVWGLLVDGSFEPGLPPADPHPLAIRSGDPRVDVQSALAMLGAGMGASGSSSTSPTSRRARTWRARRSWPSASLRSRRAAGGTRRSRRPTSTSARPPPSAFSSAGGARPTPTTSRPSTPTGSRPPSTG